MSGRTLVGMSDRLHDLEPGTATCRRGCPACAQLEADFAHIRMFDAQRRVNDVVERVAIASELYAVVPPATAVALREALPDPTRFVPLLSSDVRRMLGMDDTTEVAIEWRDPVVR